MKNYKVLFDGYNLGLSQGSGIKYYTINLIEILKKYSSLEIGAIYGFHITNEFLKEIEFIFQMTIPMEENKFAFIKNLLNSFLNKEILRIDFKNSNIDEKFLNEFLKKNNYLNNINIYNNDLLFLKSKFKHITLNNFGYDILHVTYPLNFKIKSCKKITTIHDVIPLVLPNVSLEKKESFFNLIKKSIETSDKIITISESSKRDIMKFFDVDENKIINTYQSIRKEEYSKDTDNIFKIFKNTYSIKENEYFLFVGNIEPKKNVDKVIQAFLNINTEKKFIIVGKKAWLWKELLKGSEKAIQNGKIIMLDYVTRYELIALYQHAFGFVFPSLYEGFGLPPLEAMACKCPVITSNVSSLPEVCENAAIYCDPYSVKSIQEAMEKLLNLSNDEREKLIQIGLKRVEFFNEKDYAKRILNVYESVL